jgi:scyllo-inositol 2-dehydrogenase (NADP+)
LSSEIIPVALVGFGFAGRTFHAPVIRSVPGLELASILQRAGNSAQETYPDVRIVRNMDELLADQTIRLVVIATPNDSHYPLARQCLLAGRDVVVDKPFTTNSQDAHELDQLARSQGRLLSVHHNRRWDGDFLTVQKMIGSGVLGRLTLFESHYDRYRPARRPGSWRELAAPGSGVLFDLGSHLVDQAFTLFGQPEAITASVRLERDHAVADDAFDIMLRFPSLTVLLRATMLACEPGPRFILNGTLGTYIKYGMDPQEDALKAGVQPGTSGWGQEPESHWGTLTLAEETGAVRRAFPTEPGDYREFYSNVRDAIAGKAPLAVTAAQATSVIRLLEAARDSSKKWPAV